MEYLEAAYRMYVLWDQKFASKYFELYKGEFGRIQVDVLNYLYGEGKCRPQSIAASLNISKQHVSKILARFDDLGLVVKEEDATDGRSCRFSLSDKGNALVKTNIEKSASYSLERLSELNEEDIEKFHLAMEELIAVLEKL